MYEGLITLRKNLSKYIALLLASSLILGGCSFGSKNNGSGKKKNTSSVSLQMRIPTSLNPLLCENQSVRDAFSVCYEPLFLLNEKMLPEGVLARSINLTDDCMGAIITLKDSVLWHDGIKFTSADVVHTISLLKGNPSSPYYECVKYIENAQSIDPLSLRLTLSRPYGQIAYSLYFPIVPVHKENIEDSMVGTGPYTLHKYTPSVLLEMKKFDSWHGGDALSDKISISLIKDKESATQSFNAGMINTITNKSFDTENKVPRKNTRTTLFPSSEYEFLVFNHDSSPFSSSAIRSAVSSAINREEIAKECYGTAAQAANLPLHPSSEKMAPSSSSVQYNLEHTREMLFLEGYTANEKTHYLQNEKTGVLSFTLLVNKENESRKKCARVLQSQLSAAGIQMEIRELDFASYVKAIQGGSFQAYLGGTKIGNLMDFEFLLSKNGALNNYGYSDEAMEAALLALASSASEEALRDTASDFEELFLRTQPICGLVFKKDSLITADNIMGKLLPLMDYPYKNISKWTLK